MNQTTPNTRTEQTILVGRGKAALQLPVWFQGGSAVHPMLAITSMVHGDEYEALAAVLEFWKSIERRKLNGSVLILPVCNPLAAEAATRSTPERFDGKNLARVFPGSARGTITPQIARRIWEITEEADVLAFTGVHPGSLSVEPGMRLDPKGDHRMAMALALIAKLHNLEVRVRDTSCVAKSWPGFWGWLAQLDPQAG